MFMGKFYILMTLLLTIGVINLVRALKEKESSILMLIVDVFQLPLC